VLDISTAALESGDDVPIPMDWEKSGEKTPRSSRHKIIFFIALN
jgi:hypothetical protein